MDVSALIKTNEGWKFSTERDLEDFVWNHLEHLFNFCPLKRQYISRSEICDILAVRKDKQLAILELKNFEDRYIVQQLTRYYDSLIDEKPFADKLDFDLSIQLFAIAPTFHRHNLVDCKYSNLSFTFLCFEITQNAKQLYFSLKDLDGFEFSKLTIPYPSEYVIDTPKETVSLRAIPKPSKAFQKVLDEQLSEHRERILQIRQKFLRFDERIGELNTAVTVRYGLKKGKDELHTGKQFAEFYSEFFKGIFHGLHLYLWLPFPTGRIYIRTYNQSEKGIMKLDIWGLRESSWQTVSELGLKRNPNPRAYITQSCNFEFYSEMYAAITGKKLKSNSLDELIDLALEEWLQRL